MLIQYDAKILQELIDESIGNFVQVRYENFCQMWEKLCNEKQD